MLSNQEIIYRALNGPICNEKEFDLKRFIPAVRGLVKKYGIKYTSDTVVPWDDDLADRVWQAGRELICQVGVLCLDTERVIQFTPEELDQALAGAPKNLVLGTGQQAKRFPVRRPESDIPPLCSLGAAGTGVTSEEIFLSLVRAYAELPYTDIVCSPALTQIDGMPVIAGSPLEVEACTRTILLTREGARRAGRAGLGIANTIATGVRSQGHIAGNAMAANQHDMMEIGNIAEMKIDFDNLSKIAYMQSRGHPILGETGPVIGGYCGGPEGTALTMAGYHFFALLILRAHVQHPFAIHFQLGAVTGRQSIWVRSVSQQAITRHSDVPCLDTGTIASGPATGMGLYEVAALVAPPVASGGSVEVLGTAQGTHPDYLSPVESLLGGEIAHAVAGMPRKAVNDFVLRVLEKYESRLADPPLGMRYQDCFDIVTRQPKKEALEHYKRVRADLHEMGLEFKSPPYYN